jgi:serine/threonine protein kinase
MRRSLTRLRPSLRVLALKPDPTRPTCPVCDSDSFPDSHLSLLSCSCCHARFLPPGTRALPLIARRGTDGYQPIGQVQLDGEILARFEPDLLLTAGPFGTIYRAREFGRSQAVAIQLVAGIGDPAALVRFISQGRLLAQLADPNVVRVRHAGEVSGNPYLVMEYRHDGTLADRLNGEGHLEALAALTIMQDIACGLAACHARRIVHHDLRPDSVLLDGESRASLAPPGVARDYALADASMSVVAASESLLRYLSPEECRGEPAGAPSDIYAAGLLFYEMLAGEPAFRPDTPSQYLHAHQHQNPVAVQERADGVPDSVARLIGQMLSKKPEHRPSIGDLLMDLKACEADALAQPRAFRPGRSYGASEPPPAPVGWGPIGLRMVLLVLTLLCCLLATGLRLQSPRRETTHPPAQSHIHRS